MNKLLISLIIRNSISDFHNLESGPIIAYVVVDDVNGPIGDCNIVDDIQYRPLLKKQLLHLPKP